MKASAGGGGKGMRVAWNEEELLTGYVLVQGEARASFGNTDMMLQHYVYPYVSRFGTNSARAPS